jgi:hypothetical protein
MLVLCQNVYFVRFEVLTAAFIKIMVFRGMIACSLMDELKETAASVFRVPSTLKLEATGYSKMLLPVYQAILRHIPEDHIVDTLIFNLSFTVMS